MVDPQPDKPPPDAWRFNTRALLVREWPYLLVLILAIFGVAYTSFSRTPITTYWIVLAPLIGLIPLGPTVLLTARPPERLFHLVLESHDGRAPGADSEEKHEPVSDIDTIVVDSLKALDPEWPIREADIHPRSCYVAKCH